LYNSHQYEKQGPPLLQEHLQLPQGKDIKIGEQEEYSQNDEENWTGIFTHHKFRLMFFVHVNPTINSSISSNQKPPTVKPFNPAEQGREKAILGQPPN
jgi:hypothetical protein